MQSWCASCWYILLFFFQAEDGIRDKLVTGVQTVLFRSQYEPALNNLALSLASRGLLEDAVPLLRRVLKINPENGRAAYNLALIALRLKRFNEAVEAFQLARRVHEPAAPSETIALGEGTALF